MKKILLIVIGIIAYSFYVYMVVANFRHILRLFQKTQASPITKVTLPSPTPLPSPSPSPTLPPLPTSKILDSGYHVFQTFNNCGPASLSMALSYYDFSISQQELGVALRPYQIPNGDNDDKSVTLNELAQKAKDYGLIPFHRPRGTQTMIKHFLANNMPIITRTWTKLNEDIGHYRLIKGYDDTTQSLLQDDSLQGKNLWYTYDEFNQLWEAFNYEFLVLVPPDKETVARAILGEFADEKTAWKAALVSAQKEGELQPESVYAHFNASVAAYHIGDFQTAVTEFEMVESRLSMRMLWYQIEPIQAYYELGNYDRVFEITDRVLNNHNRAFSELYLIRGQIYLKQGNQTAAKAEFEKAVEYNVNLKAALDALASVN